MAKIVTVEQMVAIEKKAHASGLGYDQMMDNAGKSVANRILSVWPLAKQWRILILVGPGNNGGDGLVAGYYLSQAGADVSYYLLKERSEEDANLKRVRKMEAMITLAANDRGNVQLNKLVESTDLLIDALLGTGFKLPLSGEAQALLKKIGIRIQLREEPLLVAAIDCPSGMDCDSGEAASECIRADITVTLAAAKMGLLTLSGADYAGRIFIGEIGLNPKNSSMAEISLEMMDWALAKAWLPQRARDAHKGTFGQVLIVAGSINYPGAAVLAARGAYRSGSGLVTLAVPEPIYAPLVSILPEATWIMLPHDQGVISSGAVEVLEQILTTAQALLIGPGFGQERSTEQFMTKLFTGSGPGEGIGFMDAEQPKVRIQLPPLVLDADALKLVTRMKDWASLIPAGSILTPHPGEMSALTGLPVEKVQEARIKTAQEWSRKWGHVVVLKGAFTVVASPEGQTMVIPIATPALARAGTGDVLAGIIVGLRGQGLEAYEAAALGAYLHGRAGELAAEIYQTTTSVIAGDIVDALSDAIAEIEAS